MTDSPPPAEDVARSAESTAPVDSAPQAWNLPGVVLEKLPAAMAQIAFNRKGDHKTAEQIRAAGLLVQMHGQNVNADLPPLELRHLHVHASLAELRREALEDPAFLEFCRGREVESAE